jgi:hypothetical protein
LTFATAGFALAPRPKVIYPAKPVKALAAVVAGPAVGKGIVTSVIDNDAKENTAYSVAEYAKQTWILSMKVITRGECGSMHSYNTSVGVNEHFYLDMHAPWALAVLRPSKNKWQLSSYTQQSA